MTTYRITFEKTGRARYISHLDLMRCMQRALKRSGLPVWYTEGFHPHMYMTFALPLPLGYESRCEAVDIRLLTEDIPVSQLESCLSKALPPDLRLVRVAVPTHPATAIAAARYRVELSAGEPVALEELLRSYLADPQLIVEKWTKKGAKQVDLKPHIRRLDIEGAGNTVTLTLELSAGNTVNFNPTLFTDAFAAAKGLTLSTQICREALLLEDGTLFQ